MFKLHFNFAWPRISNREPLLRSYLVPVCLSCCFIIFCGCAVKPGFAVEWDKTFEIRDCELNAGYGLENFGINSVGGKVQLNGRIDTLELGADRVIESMGSSNKSIPPLSINRKSVRYKDCNESTANSKEPKIANREIDTENYHILWSLLPIYIVVFGNIIFFTQRQNKARGH